MSRTVHCSGRSRPSRAATAGLLALALFAAACGTTEARSNPELEPGSGDLGSGDAVESPDELDAEDVTEDEIDVEAEETATSIPGTLGPLCATREAQSEIRALPTRVFDEGVDLETRLTAVQLGDDPEVLERARTQQEREQASGDQPEWMSTVVSDVTCVDDGSATFDVERRRTRQSITLAGSAMLVDGAWKLTLFSLCRWNTLAPCFEREGLQDRATDSLSPALRADLDR